MTPPREPPFTVICLPGVGRSSAAYRSWPRHLPPGVRLVCLELPSDGYPDDVPLQARAVDLRERLGRAGHLDAGGPVAVFGHSFGAVVGYELAHVLADWRPRLFVAAAGDPRLAPAGRDSELDDDALVARLLELSDASVPLLDPDVREALLPKIRADLRLEEGYRADPVVADFPVTVFGGLADPVVRPEDLAAWRGVTTQPVDIQLLPGGHLFVDDHAVEICAAITATMIGTEAPEPEGSHGPEGGRTNDPGESWLPLTPAQEGMWLDSQLVDSPTVRHLLLALTLKGALDADRLSAAWSAVVRAHPGLRAAIALRQGTLRQRLPGSGAPVPVLPVLTVPAYDVANAIERTRRLPIDLGAGRLYTATLLRIDDSEHLFVLALHHIVGDARSQQILLDDLVAAYEGRPFPGVDRYPAVIEQAQRSREPAPESVAYWRGRLPDEHCALPAGVTSSGSLHTRWTELRVDGSDWRRVRFVAEAEGVSPALVLLAALVPALGRVQPGRQLVIGMPLSTRDDPEWDHTVGLFLDTLILVLNRPAPGTSFADTIRDVSEEFADSWAHHIPFRYVVAANPRPRVAGRMPLAEISFNYLSRPLTATSPTGLAASLLAPDLPEARFPLGIYCHAGPEQLLVQFGWHTSRLSEDWVDRLVTAFERLLRDGMGRYPDDTD